MASNPSTTAAASCKYPRRINFVINRRRRSTDGSAAPASTDVSAADDFRSDVRWEAAAATLPIRPDRTWVFDPADDGEPAPGDDETRVGSSGPTDDSHPAIANTDATNTAPITHPRCRPVAAETI